MPAGTLRARREVVELSVSKNGRRPHNDEPVKFDTGQASLSAAIQRDVDIDLKNARAPGLTH
jgi:hypothetical protein